MFQRAQSVFIIAAMLLIVCSYFIPFGTFSDGVNGLNMGAYGIKNDAGEMLNEPSSYFLYIVHFLILVIDGYALISFKKRSLQIRVLRFGFLMFAISFILIALYINDGNAAFPGMHFTPGISLFLPIGAVLFNWLAARSVRKDEELVRSVDRIR